jgi:hypothetical protein
MSDFENTRKQFTSFLESDEQRTILIKGYDDDAKIGLALTTLNSYFEFGIIRCIDMGSISHILNRSFTKEMFPRIISSTKNYKLGNMTLSISSYNDRTKNNLVGNDNTFTMYCPVQSVMKDEERLDNLFREIGNSGSRKIILVTTNDLSIDTSDIEDRVDRTIVYHVENDNPDLVSTIKRNFKNNRFELLY